MIHTTEEYQYGTCEEHTMKDVEISSWQMVKLRVKMNFDRVCNMGRERGGRKRKEDRRREDERREDGERGGERRVEK